MAAAAARMANGGHEPHAGSQEAGPLNGAGLVPLREHDGPPAERIPSKESLRRKNSLSRLAEVEGETNEWKKRPSLHTLTLEVIKRETENEAQQDLWATLANRQKNAEPPCCSANPRDWCPQGSTFEPVDIIFNELAKEHKYSSWKEVPPVMQVELIRKKVKPRGILIEANSAFMRRWDIIMLFCLIFVAIMTPYDTAFDPGGSWEEVRVLPMWWINKTVDMFFLFDMGLQFFLKAKVRQPDGSMKTLRTHKEIARNYFRGWFMIDFVSIVPIDVILMVWNKPELSKLKSVKIIRLLRLLKLIRVLRASRMFARWQNHISITYSTQALVMSFVLLAFSAHLAACLWGMAGIFYLDMECPGGEAGEPLLGEGEDAANWISALHYAKDSPDTPCTRFSIYLWALHWSVMSITSIGYGDIAPQRSAEYVVCIIGMLAGGILWAYIIGTLCGVVSNMDPCESDFRASYDAVNYMMDERKLPDDLRLRVREYFRERKHMARLQSFKKLEDMMSVSLRGEVLLEVYMQRLQDVWYFQVCTREFLICIARFLGNDVVAPREYFPKFDRLWFMQRGSACREGKLYVGGTYFGEDMILSETLQNRSQTLAMTYCEVEILTKQNLTETLKIFPLETSVVRSAEVRLAVKHAILLVAHCCKQVKGKDAAPELILQLAVRRARSQDEVGPSWKWKKAPGPAAGNGVGGDVSPAPPEPGSPAASPPRRATSPPAPADQISQKIERTHLLEKAAEKRRILAREAEDSIKELRELTKCVLDAQAELRDGQREIRDAIKTLGTRQAVAMSPIEDVSILPKCI